MVAVKEMEENHHVWGGELVARFMCLPHSGSFPFVAITQALHSQKRFLIVAQVNGQVGPDLIQKSFNASF